MYVCMLGNTYGDVTPRVLIRRGSAVSPSGDSVLERECYAGVFGGLVDSS